MFLKKLLTNQTVIITILILITAFLRFYNLNWDLGNFFHPDERNIANAVSRISFFDDLNPQFFAYGGFSIYLYRAAGELLTFITKNPAWLHDWSHINVLGRFFSALFSTLTIIPLFFLAKKLFNKEVAIFSTIIFSFTVASIQTAHYGVTESLLVLLLTLITLISLISLTNPSKKLYLLAGAALGLAGATKTTALSFVLITLIPLISPITLISPILLLSSAFVFFTLFSPYTFLSWNKFLESMHYEQGVATGSIPVPYTLQFTHTIPYLYQLQNLPWQMGIIAPFAIAGIIILTVLAIKQKKLSYFLFLIFPLVYFAYVGWWHTKFIRYMMPTLPFLTVAGAYCLYLIKERFKIYGEAIAYAVLILTALWGLAFFTIYTRPQTRIVASEWIYQNIPLGSIILTEHWDDGLPVPLPQYPNRDYKVEALAIYEPDNNLKPRYFAQKLSQADYIVLNSRRLYGTLMFLPDKYPITSKYYYLLFTEQLGYKKVAEFSSYPSLFGLEINDDSSEETFQVYEHPKVIIFKNTDHLSYQEISQILAP